MALWATRVTVRLDKLQSPRSPLHPDAARGSFITAVYADTLTLLAWPLAAGTLSKDISTSGPDKYCREQSPAHTLCVLGTLYPVYGVQSPYPRGPSTPYSVSCVHSSSRD